MNGLPASRPASRRRRLSRSLRAWMPVPLIDFWAGQINPLWTWDRPLARIVAREQAASDAVTLWLQPNRHFLGFAPGQHVEVGVELDGSRVLRSYSLCEPPRADGRIAITVKQIDGGRVSTHLCRDARIGGIVTLGQAYGELRLPRAPAALLLLAAGSGITPLMSLVRAAAARGFETPVTLLYSVRDRAQRCFVGELRQLAAAHPGFRVHFFHTRDEASSPDEHAGRIDAAALAAVADDRSGRLAYACGPGAFVEAMRALCTDAAGFQAEAFTPPPRQVEDHGQAQVTLARSGRTLQLARGIPLLEALEGAGLKPKHGCRRGICNSCSCRSSGSVRNLDTGALAHEPSTALKLCIHGAAGDLVLDL